MIDHAAWHEARRRGIGSSDVAAIYGLDRWRSAVDVWREKTGQAEPTPETPEMTAGTLLEPLAVRMAAEQLGAEVRRWPQDLSVDHAGVPIMRATPDAEVADGQLGGWLVECKVVTAQPWESVPMSYQLQVQHQLAVLGRGGALVAQLTRGTLRLTLHEIRRHEPTIHRLETELPEWWSRHVIHGEAPMPRTRADVVLLHPRPSAGVLRLGEDALALVEDRDRLGAEINRLTTERDAITNTLARTLGPAEMGLLPDGRVVTFRSRKAHTRPAVQIAETRQIRVSKRLPKSVDESMIVDETTPVAWYGSEQ